MVNNAGLQHVPPIEDFPVEKLLIDGGYQLSRLLDGHIPIKWTDEKSYAASACRYSIGARRLSFFD
ncbi:hypothetical protein J2T20_002197 [Paenibacillus wynnii]|nr:hypothetical protein [Paenibacillus wynnii]